MNKRLIFACLLGISVGLPSCNSVSTKTEELSSTPEEKQIPVEAASSQTESSRSLNLIPFVYGIDISKFQGKELAILDTKKDSLGFVIAKATEGITYTDPDFATNWKTIAEKGLVRGSYHFYRSQDAPQAQAEHYLSNISDLRETDLPPIVDFEEGSLDGSESVQKVQTDLLKFLQLLEKRVDRMPMIYTDIHTGDKYLDGPEFAKYPLWIANYRTGNHPELPAAWQTSKWLFWQKSDSYTIRSTQNDFDIFNGNMEELREFIEGR